MTTIDSAGSRVDSAVLFYNNAEAHFAADNAVDAISRMYYACFHIVFAVMLSLGQTQITGSVSYPNRKTKTSVDVRLTSWTSHKDIRESYMVAYNRSSELQLVVKGWRNLLARLDSWQNLREDFDYRLMATKVVELDSNAVAQYSLMKKFIAQNAAFVCDKLGIALPIWHPPSDSSRTNVAIDNIVMGLAGHSPNEDIAKWLNLTVDEVQMIIAQQMMK